MDLFNTDVSMYTLDDIRHLLKVPPDTDLEGLLHETERSIARWTDYPEFSWLTDFLHNLHAVLHQQQQQESFVPTLPSTSTNDLPLPNDTMEVVPPPPILDENAHIQAYFDSQVDNTLQKVQKSRIIHLASSFRNRRFFPTPTEFTIPLSESLKNVLEISLLNATIPSQWNYISTEYGANFMFFKGNAPGIQNNAAFEYQLRIPNGVQSSAKIIDSLNTHGVPWIQSHHPDVFFEITFASFESSGFTQCSTRIEKPFDTQDFHLRFLQNSSSSLMHFLGFDQTTLSCTTLLSPAASSIDWTTLSSRQSFLHDSFFLFLYRDPLWPTRNASYEFLSSSLVDTPSAYLLQQIPFSFPATSNITFASWMDQWQTVVDTHPSLLHPLAEIRIVQSETDALFRLSLSLPIDRQNAAFNAEGTKYILVFDPLSTWVQTFQFLPLQELHLQTGIHVSQQSEIEFVPHEIQVGYFRCISPTFMATNPPFTQPELAQVVAASPATAAILPMGKNDFLLNMDRIPHPGESRFASLTEVMASFQQAIDTSDAFTQSSLSTNTEGHMVLRLNYTQTFSTDRFQVILESSDALVTLFGFSAGAYPFTSSSSIQLTSRVFTNEQLNTLVQLQETIPLLHVYPALGSLDPQLMDMPSIAIPQPSPSIRVSLNAASTYITSAIQRFVGADNTLSCPLSKCELRTAPNNNGRVFHLTLSVQLQLVESNFEWICPPASSPTVRNLWDQLQFDTTSPYRLADAPSITLSPFVVVAELVGNQRVQGYDFTTSGVQDGFELVPITNGLLDPLYHVTILMSPNTTYTRKKVLDHINTELRAHPITQYCSVSTIVKNTSDPVEFIQFHLQPVFTFHTRDFKLTFYDPELFANVNCGGSADSTTNTVYRGYNTTVDGTLGWTLGFQKYVEMSMNPLDYLGSPTFHGFFVEAMFPVAHTSFYNESTHVCTFHGDASRLNELSMFQYLYVVLQDYTQSVFSDGLISTGTEELVSVPQKKNRIRYDPVTCAPLLQDGQTLTSFQAQLANLDSSQAIASENYKARAFTKDVFAIIQVKPNSDVYDGGWMKNQTRVYTGPVNLSKFTVRLLTDRGTPLQLNADWSFTLDVKYLS
jgi:hypothetical protein